MTERKPRGEPFETFIDRLIREAQDQGAFDSLRGAGKPIPGLDAPHDESWWLRSFIKREGLDLLPPSLELRREIERALPRILKLQREEAVRSEVRALNARIRRLNASGAVGPPSDIASLDEDAVVERWRRRART